MGGERSVEIADASAGRAHDDPGGTKAALRPAGCEEGLGEAVTHGGIEPLDRHH
jgi:hypothetical protein